MIAFVSRLRGRNGVNKAAEAAITGPSPSIGSTGRTFAPAGLLAFGRRPKGIVGRRTDSKEGRKSLTPTKGGIRGRVKKEAEVSLHTSEGSIAISGRLGRTGLTSKDGLNGEKAARQARKMVKEVSFLFV